MASEQMFVQIGTVVNANHLNYENSSETRKDRKLEKEMHMSGVKFNKADKVILATILIVIFAIIGILNSFADAEETLVYEKYIVQKGDTLWKIASKAVPENNPRSTVEEIKKKNNLDSSLIYVGQIILIPSQQKTAVEKQQTLQQSSKDSK